MESAGYTLSLLPHAYAIVRLAPTDAWPAWAREAEGLVVVARTDEELSIVCREAALPADVARAGAWRALRVHGPFPFDTVGVLASLSGALARAQVSVLAVSTYDTDYLLVRAEQLEAAVAALSQRNRVLGEEGGGHG